MHFIGFILSVFALSVLLHHQTKTNNIMESLSKEKALKLYKENLEWIGDTFYKDGTYNMSEHEKAKGCSLNAVNEILSWNNTFFWQEVKQELLKL